MFSSPTPTLHSPSLSKRSESAKTFNEFYAQKQERQNTFRRRVGVDADKYFPPNLRSPSNEKVADAENDDNHLDANVKLYSIALKSPNDIVHNAKHNENEQDKIEILGSKNILSPLDTNRSYQDIHQMAVQEANQVHTTSERGIKLKRIIGALPRKANPFVQLPNGTAPIYQTADFTWEQRTRCMIISGLFVFTLMLVFVALLIFAGAE